MGGPGPQVADPILLTKLLPQHQAAVDAAQVVQPRTPTSRAPATLWDRHPAFLHPGHLCCACGRV